MKCECEIGMVLACQVEECSYNQGRECRAERITAGDAGSHAACDTFTTGQDAQPHPGQSMVSNCEVSRCKFNDQSGTCDAPAVSLGQHEQHAECDSFVPGR